MNITLPQLSGDTFLTDGGLETDLIFNRGFDLPAFASYPLLRTHEGRAALRSYFEEYVAIAREHGRGAVVETATWRANPAWGAGLGDDAAALDVVNRLAVTELLDLRAANPDVTIVVSGAIGPRGDGYVPDLAMSPDEAETYHLAQVASLAEAGADLVTAFTLTTVAEAIGVTRAARQVGIPAVVGLTVETDGALASGPGLAEAIEAVDAATDGYAAYFMVNCAHPTHFSDRLDGDGAWRERLRAVRANASTMSHEELDASEELDAGDPADLAQRYRGLAAALPGLAVVGGCCGTDARHVRAIADALA